MTRLNRAALIGLLLLACVGCDRISKDLAQQHLASQPPMSWFYDNVRLGYAENTGAFLSAGAELPPWARRVLFQYLPGAFLTGALTVLLVARNRSRVWSVGWCLLLSGGIGNLWDRMAHDGRVIDFMNVGIGGLRTGIFNVADVCISIGVVLLLFESFRQSRQPMGFNDH